MIKQLKALFVQPSAIDRAHEELKRARRQELEHQTMAEYSAAQAKSHQVMADFERLRITRLTAYISNQNNASSN